MARLSKSVTIGGKVISGAIVRTGATPIAPQVTLAAGKAGTLTTRTDNDTGSLTLGTGHGITTGQIIDLYWDGGIRRGMTVGVVAGLVVPIDLGTGDNLPAAASAIVACVQTVINVDFDGDEVVMAAASTTRRSSVHFTTNADGNVLALDIGLSGTDGEMWDWHDESAIVNPFAAADVGKIKVSNGSSTATALVTVGVELDNVV